MKFRTTLLAALNAADLICVDGYEAALAGATDPARPFANLLRLVDGPGVWAVDQQIDMEDGSAHFDDTKGQDHELILCMIRRLVESDILLKG